MLQQQQAQALHGALDLLASMLSTHAALQYTSRGQPHAQKLQSTGTGVGEDAFRSDARAKPRAGRANLRITDERAGEQHGVRPRIGRHCVRAIAGRQSQDAHHRLHRLLHHKPRKGRQMLPTQRRGKHS